MKAILYILLVLTLTSQAIAQPELASTCGGRARKWINIEKQVGDWTWFTMVGTLYRKHVDSTTAEVWYQHLYGVDASKEYEGRLFDPSQVAHHEILTSANSSLPNNSQLVRIDEEGVVWFSNCRDQAAAFDGVQWRLTSMPEAPYSETWRMTPFGLDSAFPQASRAFCPNEKLLQSIPGNHSNTGVRAGTRIAVTMFDIHPNGNVYLVTAEGVHVFRPLVENETKLGAPSRTAAPYPNPAASTVTVALKSEIVNKMTVDVRDLTGRLRMQDVEGLSSGAVVDVTGLEEGVYVAVLRSKGATATTTFTVRR